MTPRARGRQRGFTLIELMIALVVSSLLVGMILAIFNRMSISYRGQQQIAGVQQVLAAARATIELDAKQAGLQMPQGFKLGGESSAIIHPSVVWTDSSTGPDSIAFFYGDPTLQATIAAPGTINASRQITVDSNPGFTAGSYILLVNTDTSTASVGAPLTSVNPLDTDPTIARFDACATKISAVSGNLLTLSTAGPWGKSTATSNCTIMTGTMVYSFVARAYRIDTSNDTTITSGAMYPSARGTLQLSLTGGLLSATGSGTDAWNDLAYGFTDIQIATRFYDSSATASDLDGDGDPNRNWYAGAAGVTQLAASFPASTITPITMSISLVARTDRDIEGIATSQTPTLIGPTGTTDYNSVGNRASVALPAQAPWVADTLLKGSRVYRYVTFQTDLRNLGVGR